MSWDFLGSVCYDPRVLGVFRKFLFKSLCPVSARRDYIVRKSPCPGIFSEVFLKSLCLSLGSGRGLGLGPILPLDLGLG